MRNHVVNRITALAQNDESILLLTGDLGFGVLDEFSRKYPDRYVNCGIAEQNMASVAAGLALEGNMVFIYSIGNFPTLRCIEQVRNDICYHDANVKIIAVGGGFAYGTLGMTHHATEDIAMMRALPNMRVFVPADAIEAVAALEEAYRIPGPCYIRLARGGEPNCHSEEDQFDVTGCCAFSSVGEDVNILTTGTVLEEGLTLRQLLEQSGYSAGIFSLPCVKPLSREPVEKLARSSRLLVSMEDHNIVGGFGGAIAEILSEISGVHAVLHRIGLQDTYTCKVGSQDYLRREYGISAESALPDVIATLSKLDAEGK